MKKLLSLAMLLFTLTACGNDEPSPASPDEPTNEEQPATPDTPDVTEEDIDSTVTPPPVGTIALARGADISWVTEQEKDGILFHDKDGKETDCFKLMRQVGMNAIRLRVWVNPETPAQKEAANGGYGSAYCGKDDVVAKAVRAQKAGLAVMIDFHYSDIFADPSRQATPTAWRGKTLDEVGELVASHTQEVLRALQDAGVSPHWIQIGNETRPGMLHPHGQLWNDQGDIKDGWKNYAYLSNAGYDAAKAICPDAIVMVHIDNAYEDNTWWFDKMKAAGGKFDMIGLSHYPMTSGKTWQEANSLALQHIKAWTAKYNVPIMVSEVGVKPSNADAAKCMESFMTQAKAIDGCAGAFYWEPQVYGGWRPTVYKDVFGWGSYDMGAFNSSGRPHAILDAFQP